MKTSSLIFGILWCIYCQAYTQNLDSSKDKVVQQQIFLDEQNFSPGKIDGQSGYFTEQAMHHYKESKPFQKEKVLPPPYTVYKISTKDQNYIGSVPTKIKMQAQKKKIPYSNFAEMIAERFHTDIDFLAKINPDINLKRLKTGDTVKVPNVKPFLIEQISKKEIYKKGELSNRIIKINTQKKVLTVLEDNKIIATFPITPGSSALPAPKGKWKVKNIIYLPWFRYDKKMLEKGERSAHYYNLPPGPNSLVGIIWVGLNKKGIGIHGTNKPELIGRSTSHGCIRLANWDIVKLSNLIRPGVKVEIDL
jgi:lipoprotein-anchoring transpeptidase ErfK/SrfK